jgi:hypothetical protein
MLPTGPGAVLELIRTGRATTRGELIAHLGWSRVTLGRRLDELVGAGLIVSGGQLDSSGGRPPERLAVNKDAGVLLALDIGGSHTRIGLTDLVSNVLEEDEADIGNEDGPDDIFEWALQVWDFLLAQRLIDARAGRTQLARSPARTAHDPPARHDRAAQSDAGLHDEEVAVRRPTDAALRHGVHVDVSI